MALAPESPSSSVQAAGAALLLNEPLAAAEPPSSSQLWCIRAATFAFEAGFFLLRLQTADYVLARCCAEAFNATACEANAELLEDSGVQQQATLHTTWTIVCQGAVAVATTMWFTAASDRCGRKPVLAASCGSYLAGSIGYLVISVVQPEVWWLVVPSLIMGLGGSYGTFNASMFAATADHCASAQSRSRAFSILESAIFLAGSLSPILGGGGGGSQEAAVLPREGRTRTPEQPACRAAPVLTCCNAAHQAWPCSAYRPLRPSR